ncbi:MAG: right-handed parallel beta-helix repeat-containing protein, partial [Candidatus Omnitrophica bacterium]|nr:right-handed parallel beta-helix repeat-containing protein [Candidatus Omnitrophota bacterium]
MTRTPPREALRIPGSEVTERENMMHTIRPTGKLILLLIGTALLASQARSATVFVNGSLATGANNGASWADAYRGSTALSDALNATGSGNEIWVAQGTYIPTRDRFGNSTNGNEATFILKGPNFMLLGGFVGNETNRNDRNPEANPTILSGNSQKWHVVSPHQDNGVTLSTVLDGFIITGGDADGDSANDEDRGAGLKTSSANLTISNCTFLANRSISDGAGAWVGASILVNCKFLGNFIDTSGAAGAGLFAGAGPTVVNCLFSGNRIREDGNGAGLSATDPTVINCAFSNNLSSSDLPALGNGGGIYLAGGTAAPIRNCILWGNSAGTNAQIGGSLGAAQVSHSIVQGGFAGTGNLNADPQFVDPDGADNTSGTGDDDLHLNLGSPAIDAGSNGHLPADSADLDRDGNTAETLPIDLFGNPRVTYESCGIVDMGVHEAVRATPGPIFYVDKSAAGANTGETWANAFTDLNTALCAAQNSVAPNPEIWVANGAYAPDRGTGDRNAAFVLASGVAVYGGFQGNDRPGGPETSRDQRNTDPTSNGTVLSGEIGVIGDFNDNSRTIVIASNVDATAILDGFKISLGFAEVAGTVGFPDRNGAGLFASQGSPTIRNCWFDSNVAQQGGGGAFFSYGFPTIEDCLFTENVGIGGRGGGIAFNSPPGILTGNLRLVRCRFVDNLADFDGGGVSIFGQTAQVISCEFFENDCFERGGGIGCLITSDLLVANSVFSGNHAPVTGGGLWMQAGPVKLVNNTFSRNSTNLNFGGGGVFQDSGSISISNCIFWQNSDSSGVDEGSQFARAAGTSTQPFDHNLVDGLTGGGLFSGPGNVSGNPLFVDEEGPDNMPGTADDNLRLIHCSPALGAGSSAALPADVADLDADADVGEPTPLDADGNPRISPAAIGLVDIGAYELQVVVPGPIVYVDVNAAGANDGSSWADAFTSLKSALCTAEVFSATVEEIWVAAGTYRPDLGLIDPSRSFDLVEGVGVYGGFAGTETQREERNPVANVTILSGDLLGDDNPSGGQFDPTFIENTNHIVSAIGLGSTAVLDGFTITGGHAHSGIPGPDVGRGAGIYIIGGGPTLANLKFHRNFAWISGGGLFSSGASPSVTSCVFSENVSNDGFGAGGGAGAYVTGGSPEFTACMFITNDAPGFGGGIHAENTNLTVVDGTFQGNTSNNTLGGGGGGIRIDGGAALVRGSLFENNSGVLGGGISVTGSSPRILACTFRENRGVLRGGGIDSLGFSSGPLVVSCVFEGNYSIAGGGAGNFSSISSYVNCVFSGNHGKLLAPFPEAFGGAFYNDSSEVSLVHCTVAGNVADTTGGGFYNTDSSSVTIENSIVWLNSHGGGITDFESQVFNSTSGSNSLTVARSDFQFLTPLLNGNIDDDPLFIRLPDDGGDGFGNGNDDYGNLRFPPNSPALDALDASTLPPDTGDIDDDGDVLEPLPLDADGFPRVKDITVFNHGGTVDMGAYELPTANIRFWGEELEPPVGVDDPVASPPLVDNASAAFIHPFDNRVFGYDFGLVNVSWSAGGVPAVSTTQFFVLEATPTVCMYRTDQPNNGPPVDLSPIIDGNPIGQVIVHYNTQIHPDPNPADPLLNADIFQDTTKHLHAQKAGTVLLEYRNEQTQELLAFEVLRARNRVPLIVNDVEVGSQVFPVDPENHTPGCMPSVTRGFNVYAYQQTDDGPTKGNVYAIRPNDNPSNFEVYWLKGGYGGVCWPCELTRYTAIWPFDPQINLQSEDPKVDLSAHFLAQILYQFPVSHAQVADKAYSTSAPGMATLLYSNQVDTGREVSLEVVKTVDSRDGNQEFPRLEDWNIGDRIESPEHDLSCYSSSFIRLGTNYDPTIYSFKAAASTIIPINTGELEVWHYQKSQDVCWPYLPYVYNCVWPATPDYCLTISNQKGIGPFNLTKYQDPSIYSIGTEDSDPTVVGYNPNEEHAEWETTPGGKLYAARDDLNVLFGRSQPYVLLKYQDHFSEGDPWDMDVIQVRRTGTSSPGTCMCDQFPCDFIYPVT